MPWSMTAEPATFDSSFCIKPLALGCLIALTDRSEELTQEELFLPKKAGDALFFSSNLSYPWVSLAEQKSSQKFLLMIYAEADAAYTLTLSDPHTHNLKHLGYIFVERLKETTHPHIVR